MNRDPNTGPNRDFNGDNSAYLYTEKNLMYFNTIKTDFFESKYIDLRELTG
ncbi:MAG: hypothetical protein QMC40_00190 [Vicingaceae bacterium]|jgi:hypothetical protein